MGLHGDTYYRTKYYIELSLWFRWILVLLILHEMIHRVLFILFSKGEKPKMKYKREQCYYNLLKLALTDGNLAQSC